MPYQRRPGMGFTVAPRIQVTIASAIAVLITASLLGSIISASADGKEEEGAKWILAKYFDEPLKLDTDETAPQWRETYETEIEWIGERHIEVFAVNNATHVYFLLIWKDDTSPSSSSEGRGDGVAIIFEKAGKDGSDDVWYWSTEAIPELANEGVVSKGEWKDGKWFAVIGRRLSHDGGGVSFRVGEARKDLVKIGVWDGSKGESFETVEKEEVEHNNLVALPYIDTQPKDVYVWSGILLAAAVGFTVLEVRRHKVKG